MEVGTPWDSSSPSDEQSVSPDENVATPISYAESFSASIEDESPQLVVHVCSFSAEPKPSSKNQLNSKLNSIIESTRFSPIPEKSAPEFNGNLSADLLNNAEESLRVSADISGRSTPEVNWYLNGEHIVPSSERQEVSKDAEDSTGGGGVNDVIRMERAGTVHSLVMGGFFLMDEGSWKISCLAVNSVGAAKSSVVLGHHTETQFLSASQSQLFEHTQEHSEDHQKEASDEETNDLSGSDSEGIFEVYSPGISQSSSSASSKQGAHNVCKFAANMKVCVFGKGLICETQVTKKCQKIVDVMWLLDERVIKQSEFSRMLENEFNDIFALEISNMNILSRETKNLTCVVSLNGSHIHQTTDISSLVNEVANEGCESFFLEGTLKTQDLLLFHQFNREIVIVHSVSEMMTTDRTGQIDDKFSEKDKICFEVEVNCDGDESENLNPIWLVDGELVLSQKSYFSQVSQNCCRMTVVLGGERQLKVTRVDFYLVCASGASVEVIHRCVIKPRLIGKPYLEIIDTCSMLLVEIPLHACPTPQVKCLMNEERIESFQWEYSPLEQICSVVFQELLGVRSGDVRITLSNAIGSLSVTLTREQIQRLQLKVERKRQQMKQYRHCNDTTVEIAKPADFHSRSRQTLFRIALYQLERQSLYALTGPDFKTSTSVELVRSKFVTVTKTLQGNGSVPLSPKHGFQKTTSHVAAFSLQKEAFSAVFSKNCGISEDSDNQQLSTFVPYGGQIELCSLQQSPFRWRCSVLPYKETSCQVNDLDSGKDPRSPKKVTALIIMCDYSGIMHEELALKDSSFGPFRVASAASRSAASISQSEHIENEPINDQFRKTSLLLLSSSNPSLENVGNEGGENQSPKDPFSEQPRLGNGNSEAVITQTFNSHSLVKVKSALSLNRESTSYVFDPKTVVDNSGQSFHLPVNLKSQNSINSIRLSSKALNKYLDTPDTDSIAGSESEDDCLSETDSELDPAKPNILESANESELLSSNEKSPHAAEIVDTSQKALLPDYKSSIISKLLDPEWGLSSCESISHLPEEIDEVEEMIAAPAEEACLQSANNDLQDTILSEKSQEKRGEQLRRKVTIEEDICDAYILEGESMVLQLTVFNADRSEWLKDGRKVFGSRFSENSTSLGNTLFTHQLVWKSVQEWDDAARFHCRVWNENLCLAKTTEKKISSKEATLHVVSKPLIELPRRFRDGTVKLSRGDAFKVSLPVTGKPEPFWRWKKGDSSDGVIAEGRRGRAELKIDQVDTEDSGIYVIEATNDYGTDEKKLRLTVEAPPGPVQNLKICDVKRRICLKWDPPVDSKDSPIKTYHIQGRFTFTPKWRKLANTVENTVILDYLPNLSSLLVLPENESGFDELQNHPVVKVKTEELIQDEATPHFPGKPSDTANAFESPDEKLLVGKFGNSKAFKCVHPSKTWVELLSLTESCLFCEELVQLLMKEKRSSSHANVFLEFLFSQLSTDSILGDVSRHYLQFCNLTDFFNPQGWLSSNSEQQVAKHVLQILQAVDFLHDNNFLYLSLHPFSLALDKEREFSVKLMRFTYTTRTDPNLRVKFNREFSEFFAPEISNQQSVGRLTDSWSVGALTYFMLTGSLLNSPKPKPDWKYLSNETMSQLSHEASEFIRHSVQSNPQDRTTVKEALRHQWFQNRHCKDKKTKFATSFEEFNDLKNKIQSIVSLTQSTSIYGTLTYKESDGSGKFWNCPIDARSATPIFTEQPSRTLTVGLGDDVSLHCVVSALSPPVVTWNFLNEELRPGLKYRIGYSSSNADWERCEKQTCSLRITKCQLSDSGEYFCEATNCYGSSHFTVTVDVS